MAESLHDSTVPTSGRAGTAAGESSGADHPRVEATVDQASSAAVDVKDQTVEAAGEIKDRAGGELATLKGEARREARTLAHEARDRLGGQADEVSRRLASTVSGAGSELRTMAERSDQPDGPVAGVVRQLADRSEDLAVRLESGGYRGVADDLSRLGRNKPGLFLLGAGITGFALGRLLRNTDTRSLTEAVKGESDPAAPTFAGPNPSPGGDVVVVDSPAATYAPPVGIGAAGGDRLGS
jgi:hypothetical protein